MIVCGVFVVSFAFPSTVKAGIFDFVTNIFASEVEEDTPVHNSQNMPILTAVNNINPDPVSLTPDLIISDDSVLEASVGPLGTPLEIEKENIPDKVSVYIVRKGDTIATVAKMFDVSSNTIVWANNGKRVLKEGDELIILPVSGVKYTVQKGDTLAKIASRFKADAEEITRFNDISGALALGQEIIIPDGEITPTVKSGGAIASGTSSSSSVGFSGYFIRPTTGRISQGPHGPRRSAVDIANKAGTPIVAAASGKVIVAKLGGYNGGYGSYVVIEHPNGLQTLYAHLSSIAVTAGQKVSQGDLLGGMGSSGRSTGYHLHFEVKGGQYGKVPFIK